MENNTKAPIVVSIAGLPKRKQKKNIPRARLPLGGKVSPSECDGRRMRGNVQFLSVKQFDKPKFERSRP